MGITELCYPVCSCPEWYKVVKYEAASLALDQFLVAAPKRIY